MQVTQVNEVQTWDQALLGLPNPNILQSWTWGELKGRHGWDATRLLFQEEGKTVAAASMLRRKLPLLPLHICYVPKGPSLDWADTALAARVLAELEHQARDQKSIFVKIDPDVYYAGEVPAFSKRPACAAETARMLEAQGWHFSDDQIQFRNTVLLDLDHSEEDLLAAMKQKTRYNVRLAIRRGVTVRQGTMRDLNTFYRLYAETSQRDGFVIRPPEYYRDAWGSFLEADQARLLLADVKRETVAGLMLFVFGTAAWYMYGASSNRHRKYMPNQLLQWEAIRQARSSGCRIYDLWGAPDQMNESDPMWGVVRFKLGLGGELAQGLGAWDFVLNRTAYWLYTEIIPRYLDWRRGQQALGTRDL